MEMLLKRVTVILYLRSCFLLWRNATWLLVSTVYSYYIGSMGYIR